MNIFMEKGDGPSCPLLTPIDGYILEILKLDRSTMSLIETLYPKTISKSNSGVESSGGRKGYSQTNASLGIPAKAIDRTKYTTQKVGKARSQTFSDRDATYEFSRWACYLSRRPVLVLEEQIRWKTSL
jgi:hypothetical protein